MRQARSSRWAAKSSIVSPRTRNRPRRIDARALVLEGDEVGDELALLDPLADLQAEDMAV